MSRYLAQQVSCCNVEYANPAVVTPRHNSPVHRIDCAGIGFLLEGAPHTDQLPGAQVPLPNGHVVTRRKDHAPGADHRDHVFLVLVNDSDDRARTQIPNDDAMIPRTRNADVVICEDEALNVVAVPAQHEFTLERPQVP